MIVERTVMTKAQQTVLKKLYRRGMFRQSAAVIDRYRSTWEEHGLTYDVVKNWIGNQRNKKTEGQSNSSTVLYSKGISAYNMFCQSSKVDFKSWSSEWKKLGDEEKLQWKLKANEKMSCLMLTEEEKKRKKAKLLKQFTLVCDELLGVGVAIGGIVADKEKSTASPFGGPKAVSFFEEQGENFWSYMFGSASTSTKPVAKNCRAVLRKQLQQLFNDKFCACRPCGPKQVPYGLVDAGKIDINIIWSDSRRESLKRPSHYGLPDMKKFLENEWDMRVSDCNGDKTVESDRMEDTGAESRELEDTGAEREDNAGAESRVLEGADTDAEQLQFKEIEKSIAMATMMLKHNVSQEPIVIELTEQPTTEESLARAKLLAIQEEKKRGPRKRSKKNEINNLEGIRPKRCRKPTAKMAEFLSDK